MPEPDPEHPGPDAVIQCAHNMWPSESDEHAWALQCAGLLASHGVNATLPPFPSPYQVTREAYEDFPRRLYIAAEHVARQAAARQAASVR
jgi:hypothetical protein